MGLGADDWTTRESISRWCYCIKTTSPAAKNLGSSTAEEYERITIKQKREVRDLVCFSSGSMQLMVEKASRAPAHLVLHQGEGRY